MLNLTHFDFVWVISSSIFHLNKSLQIESVFNSSLLCIASEASVIYSNKLASFWRVMWNWPAKCLFPFPGMSTGWGCDDPSIVVTPHTPLPQLLIPTEPPRAETVEAGSPASPPWQPHSLPWPTPAGLESPGATVASYASHQQRLQAQSSQVQSSLNVSFSLNRLTLREPFRCVWLRLGAGIFVNFVFWFGELVLLPDILQVELLSWRC